MMAGVTRSARAIETLAKCDPQFADFVMMAYGGDVDPQEVWEDAFGPVRKLDDGSAPRVGNTKRRLATAGTVLGAAIGGKEIGSGVRALMRGAPEEAKALPTLVPTGIKNYAAAHPNFIPKAKIAGSGAMLGLDATAIEELRKPKAPQPVAKAGLTGLDDLVEGAIRAKVTTHATTPLGQRLLTSMGPKADEAGSQAKSGFQRSRPPGKHRAGGPPAAAPPAAAPPVAPVAAAPAPAVPVPTGNVAAAPVVHPPGAAASVAPPVAPAAGAPSVPPGVGDPKAMSFQGGQAVGNAMNAILTPTGKKVAAIGGAGLIAHHLMRGGGGGQQQAPASYDYYGKRDDGVIWSGEISKVDDDKRLAFGFASVVSVGGVPVLDRQGDVISQDEIEKAAYDYVIKSRKGGNMHARTLDEYGQDAPHSVSDLVESFVITDEKVAKMGLPEETPRGWWVGFKIHDEDTWQMVKKGERTGFSIHGRGRRVDTPVDELMGYRT
jgi:Putative phage serine protease XkdF